MSDDYIDPEDAVRIRIFWEGTWFIDAVDREGNYTEVCWDSKWTTDEHGERRWSYIETVEKACELADAFARENTPHLVGTKPLVKGLTHYRREKDDG